MEYQDSFRREAESEDDESVPVPISLERLLHRLEQKPDSWKWGEVEEMPKILDDSEYGEFFEPLDRESDESAGGEASAKLTKSDQVASHKLTKLDQSSSHEFTNLQQGASPKLTESNQGASRKLPEEQMERIQCEKSRRKVRRRVLRAIGNCQAMRSIYMDGSAQLTTREWEELLRPLRDNPVLEIVGLTSLDTAAVGTACTLLNDVLRSSNTLKELRFSDCSMTESSVSQLALGLQARSNADSTLAVLAIGGWQEPGVAKYVGEIIVSAPHLHELWLQNTGPLDEGAAKALYEALARNTSLRKFRLGSVQLRGPDVLLGAFTGSCSNRSIKELILGRDIEGLGDSLPGLLAGNKTLKEISYVYNSSFTRSQWRDIGRSLLENRTLQSFSLDPVWYKRESGWDREDEIEGLLQLLDYKLINPVIKLFLAVDSKFNASSGWKVFGRSLEHNMSLKALHVSRIFEPHHDTEELFYLPILEGLRKNITLEEFGMEGCNGKFPGGWKRVFESFHFNTSLKHLILRGATGLDDVAFNAIMELVNANIFIRTIDLSSTAWHENKDKETLVKEALERTRQEHERYMAVITDPFRSCLTYVFN